MKVLQITLNQLIQLESNLISSMQKPDNAQHYELLYEQLATIQYLILNHDDRPQQTEPLQIEIETL
jgi:hypothetical protein